MAGLLEDPLCEDELLIATQAVDDRVLKGILDTGKKVLWQTVKTQMKCQRRWHFIRVLWHFIGVPYVQIKKFYLRKNLIIFLPINFNMCLGAQKNHLIETVLLSNHNICFG